MKLIYFVLDFYHRFKEIFHKQEGFFICIVLKKKLNLLITSFLIFNSSHTTKNRGNGFSIELKAFICMKYLVLFQGSIKFN